MGITINTNLSSLLVQNSLGSSTRMLNSALERMTTGFRINSAKDDAAGYAVATNMNVKLSSLDVALDNTAMGQSLLQTASGSLDLVAVHLQRIRDLAEQAANGTYDSASRQAIQAEIDQRQEEIQRVLSSAEYNGISLFETSGVTPFAEPRAATSDSKFLKPITQLSEAEAIGQGYTLIKTKSDLTSITSGSSESNKKKYILMNDIDLMGGSMDTIALISNVDFNGNGFAIKNGTIQGSASYGNGLFSNASNSNVSNLVMRNINYGATGSAPVGGIFGCVNNGTISNCVVANCTLGAAFAIGGLAGEASSTIIKDSCTIGLTISGSSYYTPDGIAGFGSPTVTNNYSTYTTTSGTQKSASEIEAMLVSPTPPASADGVAGGDITLKVGIDTSENSTISFSTGYSCAISVNVLTTASAAAALSDIDNALSQLTSKQTEFGAVQNRLDSVIEQLNVSKTSLASSLSTVRDADIATFSIQYIKSQILQQASATLLSTANQSPSIALQLI